MKQDSPHHEKREEPDGGTPGRAESKLSSGDRDDEAAEDEDVDENGGEDDRGCVNDEEKALQAELRWHAMYVIIS